MFTSGLNKFKGLMGIEHQDSSSTFKRNQSKLLSIEEEILMEQVHRNRVEELSLAKNQQSTLYVGEKPRITVKIDGSWSKAGFNAESLQKMLDQLFAFGLEWGLSVNIKRLLF